MDPVRGRFDTRPVLIATLALLLALGAPAAASAARYVQTTGTDSGSCSTLATACATPAYAAAQATTGEVVSIGPGAFPGGVVLDRGLSLEGAGADQTVLSGAGSAEGVVVLGAGSSGTALMDVQLTGADHGIYTDDEISAFGLLRVEITDMTTSGIEVAADGWANEWFFQDVTATGNGTGMRVSGRTSQLQIEDSHFDQNQVGLAVFSSDEGDSQMDGLLAQQTTFNGNTEKGLYLEALNNSTFLWTEVADSGTEGDDPAGVDINLQNGGFADIAFWQSEISGSAGPGLRVAAGQDASLDDIELHAMQLVDNATGAEFAGEVWDAVVANSRIAGNDVGLASSTALFGGIVAQDNWWGCNDGPGAPGCDSVAVAPGAGAVDADPWLVLGITADPDQIGVDGDDASIQVGTRVDSGGRETIGVPDGTEVALATDLGEVDPPTVRLGSGLADALLVSGSQSGVATVSATLDSETVTAQVRIGLGPLARIAPAGGFDFGAVDLGQSSPRQKFTVKNVGEEDLDIDEVTVSGDDAASFEAVSVSECVGVRLAPGEFCAMKLRFTPVGTAGPKSAWLTVDGNAAETPPQVPLTGVANGGDPALGIAPAESDFGGGTPIGGVSKQEKFTVKNTGRAATTVNVGLDGSHPDQYVVTSDACSGKTLQPGEHCSVKVRFAPTAVGGKAAWLTVTGEGDAGSSATLSGYVQLPLPAINPASFSFGSVAIGDRAKQKFTIRNKGVDDLEVGAVSITGADPEQFKVTTDGCSDVMLAPGELCAVKVRFAPTSAGDKTATLSVPSNYGTPASSLSGSGIGT